MSDRNLIQLKTNGHWHYWNFKTNGIPICGAGSIDPSTGFVDFRKAVTIDSSSHSKIRKICPVCFALEVEEIKRLKT